MKFLATAGLLATNVAAFPHMMDKLVAPLADDAVFQKLKGRHTGSSSLDARQAASDQGAGALPLTPPPFDAELQYVSNQGAHAVCLQTSCGVQQSLSSNSSCLPVLVMHAASVRVRSLPMILCLMKY